MECIRCGNKDPSLFYKTQRGYYCRCCIRFSRLLIEEDEEPFNYKLSNKEVNLKLKYELTKYQKEAANKTLDLLKKGQDTVLYCVTGAGKTEIASIAINDFLKRNKKVCYAIPRREVVIELEERFRRMFKGIDIVAVYGGHHQKLVADLVLCTTHQLYRYPKTFDLLVIDAYGIIGLNSKDSTDKGFLKLSPILFSPQMRLMIDLRRKHAQNEDLSAKRSAACNSGSTVSDVVPSRLLQRQSAEHTPDVDLHRSTVRYSKDVSLACAA